MREKKSSKEKRRKHSHREAGDGARKRRSTDSSLEDPKEEPHRPVEAAAEPSDIEEGGLDLNVPFKPISAYMTDRQEMLEQCFQVLGEIKLRKMLPDELKESSLVDIKKLCWDQLQQLSQPNLHQILEGKELIAEENEAKSHSVDSQQDNNVDSTSSVKDAAETEGKQGGSGDESDVLSINADVDDSDIEGHKEDKPVEEESPATTETAPSASAPTEPGAQTAEPKLELQHDIDKSVSEILALSTPPSSKAEPDLPVAMETPPASRPAATPSAQQLALLELEMRARAIKALMKAHDLKK